MDKLEAICEIAGDNLYTSNATKMVAIKEVLYYNHTETTILEWRRRISKAAERRKNKQRQLKSKRC